VLLKSDLDVQQIGLVLLNKSSFLAPTLGGTDFVVLLKSDLHVERRFDFY